MKFVSLLKMVFVFLFGMNASAMGGWSSGGGELLKDARNPWFLNNTKDIYYCIDIDEQNFGVSKSVAEDVLIQAIQFWQTEFTQATPPASSLFGTVKIASQVFHQVKCDKQVDITFQFGQLSESQKNYLKTPSEYAAIAVRTSYSNEDMSGKGFIYISPDKGPLTYNPEGVIQNAWSKDHRLLYLTLLHELGHVFGLPHMGSFGDLMSEDFVESILASAKISSFYPTTPNFFSLPQKSSVICPNTTLLAVWNNFFKLKPTERCLQFIFSHKSDNQLFGVTTMVVLASSTEGAPQVQIAEADLTLSRFNPTFLSLIWLPAGQQVFSKNELLKSGLPDVLGISMMTASKTGSFLIDGGKDKRNLSIRFEQGKQSFTIDGVGTNGEIITIL